MRDALTPRFREEPIAPLLGGLLVRGAPRRPAPRAGRPRPRGAARLAGREPGHGRRGDRRAGAVVGAAPAQRRGHRPDPRRAGPLGRGHPRRPAAPGPARARLGARPAGRRPAARPRHPGAGRGAQGAAPRQPGGDPLGDLPLGRAAPGADRLAAGPAGRRTPADADRGDGVRGAAELRRRAPDPAGRAGGGRRGLRRRPVRRRGDRRDHAHDRALGRPGGRPPDRAARRPRPAVHPDQRHRRRRPGRRADPRGQRGARLGVSRPDFGVRGPPQWDELGA